MLQGKRRQVSAYPNLQLSFFFFFFQVRVGKINFNCPIPECTGTLEEGLVISRLSREDLAKYRYFLELRQLDSSTKPCPHCSHFTSLKPNSTNRSEHKYKVRSHAHLWLFHSKKKIKKTRRIVVSSLITDTRKWLRWIWLPFCPHRALTYVDKSAFSGLIGSWLAFPPASCDRLLSDPTCVLHVKDKQDVGVSNGWLLMLSLHPSNVFPPIQ